MINQYKFPKREIDGQTIKPKKCVHALDEVTIIVKTFRRPICLRRFVTSVREFYRDVKIYIADDSERDRTVVEEFNDHGLGTGIRYWKLPFYVGAGAGRNFLVNKVETPYFILCDDDYVFTNKTTLEIFHKLIIAENMDVLGGLVVGHDYNMRVEYGDGMLILNKGVPTAETNGIKYYDVLMNFFIAKTQLIRSIGWMPELKTVSHIDLFLSLKEKGDIRVAFTDAVVTDHKHLNENDYLDYRSNIMPMYNVLKDRFGVGDIFYKIESRLVPFTKGK